MIEGKVLVHFSEDSPVTIKSRKCALTANDGRHPVNDFDVYSCC